MASDTVDVVMSIGTYLPHYGFDFYLNVILQDTNRDSVKWNGGPKMWANLVGNFRVI